MSDYYSKAALAQMENSLRAAAAPDRRDAEIRDLRATIAATEQEHADRRVELQAWGDRIAGLEGENARLRDGLELLEGELARVRLAAEMSVELCDQLFGDKDELEHTIDDLRGEISGHEDYADLLFDECDSFRATARRMATIAREWRRRHEAIQLLEDKSGVDWKAIIGATKTIGGRSPAPPKPAEKTCGELKYGKPADLYRDCYECAHQMRPIYQCLHKCCGYNGEEGLPDLYQPRGEEGSKT